MMLETVRPEVETPDVSVRTVMYESPETFHVDVLSRTTVTDLAVSAELIVPV